MNDAYLQYKWPKKHEFCVEECEELHFSDTLRFLPDYNLFNLIPWTSDIHPWLRLVPMLFGFSVKWRFECAYCGRRRESLYLTPDCRNQEWACRDCHSLVYASQRYGHRHPLRKKLTVRKRRTLQKVVKRQKRIMARREEEARKAFSRKSIPSPSEEEIRTMRNWMLQWVAGRSIS